MGKHIIAALILCSALCSVVSAGPTYFGFSGVCDDQALIAEAAPFTNICLIDIEDERLLDMAWVGDMLDRELELVIGVHTTFFVTEGESAGDLHPDYETRWAEAIAGKERAIGALARWFYVADEPNWLGITIDDLAEAHSVIKGDFPGIETMTSLTWSSLDPWFGGRQIPTDTVGYHQYRVLDPTTDAAYQGNVALIKQHAEGRGFVYILDAWYSDWHSDGGLEPGDMALVAQNYESMALADPDCVGMIGFHWTSVSYITGARDLPEHVQREYHRIGAGITGKCPVPDGVLPQHVLFLGGCDHYAKMRVFSIDGDVEAVPLAHGRTHGEFHAEQLVGVIRVADMNDGLRFFPAFLTEKPAEIRVWQVGVPDPIYRFASGLRRRPIDIPAPGNTNASEH